TSPRSLLTGSLDAAEQSRLSHRYADALPNKHSQPAKEQHGSHPDSSPTNATQPLYAMRRLGGNSRFVGAAIALAGLALLLLAAFKVIGNTSAFFGAGSLFLLGSLFFEHSWLRRNIRSAIQGSGWWAVSRLGFRNATYRAGRSILCIALIASAAFIIVAVESF